MRRTVLNKFYGMDIYGRWFGREVKIMITFLLLMFNGSVFFLFVKICIEVKNENENREPPSAVERPSPG
jgi:hypothetical protein